MITTGKHISRTMDNEAWESHVLETRILIKEFRKSLVGLSGDHHTKEWFKVYIDSEKAGNKAYAAIRSFEDDSTDQETQNKRFKEVSHLASLYNQVLKKSDYILMDLGICGTHWYRYQTIYKAQEEKKNRK